MPMFTFIANLGSYIAPTERTVAVPGQWVICPNCSGDGRHAKHLGFFTQAEFNECFDDAESRGRYFGGGYDKQCEECHGAGKMVAPDVAACTYGERRALAAARRLDRENAEFDRDMADASAAESRMGC